MNNSHIAQEKNYNRKKVKEKTLPNSFESSSDEFPLWKSVVISAVAHPTLIFFLWIFFLISSLLGFDSFLFHKPKVQPKQDIEFVIVNKEAEPINKQTAFKSDRNSRAGGINDPKRKVVEPSPAPAPAPKKASKPAKQAQPPKAPVKNVPKQVVQQPKPQVKNQAVAPKPSKPAPSAAPKPAQKPVGAPSNNIPRAQMPKVSNAPKSPFSVAVPKNNLAQGPIPSNYSGTAKTGGSSGGGTGSGSGTSRGVAMPSPQFSTGKGTGATTGTGTGSRSGNGTGGNGTGGNGIGGYGTGGLGNPGPGNPSGRPGIDAVKQADWGPYMRELERRIKRNWNPPKGDVSKRVVMLFTIGRDGRLLGIKLLKSSGQPQSDQAAKSAIQLTAPFKALPPEFKGNSIDIEFTFDYNVLGASYR